MPNRDDISEWFDKGVREEWSHLLIVSDEFDHSDFPIYFIGDREGVVQKIRRLDFVDMQKVMAVYNLRDDKATQMEQHRAWNI